VSEPASISTGIADRYATAIFELARDEGALPQIKADCDTLAGALDSSEDFRDLIHSPLYSREQQQSAIAKLADQMGLHQITGNTLKLMASKRRLFVLRALISQLRDMIAEENGEVTADVTAAAPLNDVNINLSVDETLIGGLVVKVGSKMIDTSIRSKLAALQNTMKEVG